MVRVLLLLAVAARTSTTFEVVGSALLLAGVVMLAGVAWAFVVAGGLALLKSLDLALEGDKGKPEGR